MHGRFINILLAILLPVAVCAQEDSLSTEGKLGRFHRRMKQHLTEMKGMSLRERPKYIKGTVDSLLDAHTKIKTDTNYVARPKTNWTISAKSSLYGNFIIAYGTDGAGMKRKYRFDTNLKNTVGISVDYRGISLSLSLSPTKWFGYSSDKETNIIYYGRQFGGDLQYTDIHSVYAKNVMTGADHILVDGGRLRSLSAHGYWVFNNKKFSYPAAFLSTWMQKRSAGSWLAGVSFFVGQLDNPGDYRAQAGYSRYLRRVNMAHISLGGGYAYNFVPNRHWLLHVSAEPNILVWKRYTMYLVDADSFEDITHRMPTRFPEVFAVGRFALTYNWSRYFVGAQGMIQTTMVGTNSNFHMHSSKWNSGIYFGFRI